MEGQNNPEIQQLTEQNSYQNRSNFLGRGRIEEGGENVS